MTENKEILVRIVQEPSKMGKVEKVLMAIVAIGLMIENVWPHKR